MTKNAVPMAFVLLAGLRLGGYAQKDCHELMNAMKDPTCVAQAQQQTLQRAAQLDAAAQKAAPAPAPAAPAAAPAPAQAAPANAPQAPAAASGKDQSSSAPGNYGRTTRRMPSTHRLQPARGKPFGLWTNSTMSPLPDKTKPRLKQGLNTRLQGLSDNTTPERISQPFVPGASAAGLSAVSAAAAGAAANGPAPAAKSKSGAGTQYGPAKKITPNRR